MGEFMITPLDGGLVVLVILGVQFLKKHISDRFVPVLPFLVSWILMIPAVIALKGTVPPVWVMLSQVFLEGLKVAVLAMAAYKIQYTTIAGKSSRGISIQAAPAKDIGGK